MLSRPLMAAFSGAMALLCPSPGPAAASPGSCGPWPFDAEPGIDQSSGTRLLGAWPALVTEREIPTFAAADAIVPQPAPRLRFNELVRVVELGGNDRVRVEPENRSATGRSIWVEQDRLQCRKTPLTRKGQSLERKAFIRGEYVVGESPGVVWARPTRDTGACAEDSAEARADCTPVSSFDVYFVVDEDGEQLLLSRSFMLTDRNRLVGWVARSDVVPWDYALGLRPVDPRDRKGLSLAETAAPAAADRETVCAFPRAEDARAARDSGDVSWCRPLPADLAWYGVKERLLVLDMVAEADTGDGALPILDVVLPGDGALRTRLAPFLPEGRSRGLPGRMFIVFDEDQVAPEIMMKEDQFVLWWRLAEALARDYRGDDTRALLARAVTESVEAMVDGTLEDTGEPLGAFLARKGAIPPYLQSPLMAYSIDALLSAATVPDCELKRLRRHAARSVAMLDSVLGNRRPIVGAEVDLGPCPGMSAAGDGVPVVSEVRDEPFIRYDNVEGEPLDLRYRNRIGEVAIYWVPLWVLP